MEKKNMKPKALTVVICVLCLFLIAGSLMILLQGNGKIGGTTQSTQINYEVMNRYDAFMSQQVSDALDGVMSIKKVYWLSDYDLVAPEPNQNNYGETDDPTSLQWLLDDAAELLEGQDTLFQTDVQIKEGSKVYYYLDETILVITWKQIIDDSVYTMSEVKIADPSQFRRFLADGEYGSDKKYITSEMASTVNAVVAINGDYYAFRQMGFIVHNGQHMRPEGRRMETCFIDRNGDMQCVYRKELQKEEEIQAYIDEHGVRFSLAFGPVLIDDGEICDVLKPYAVGEGDVHNARAALGQLDSLHYLLVTVAAEYPCEHGQLLTTLAENMKELGCINAYNLDGGQSSTLVMNDKLMNYTYQRLISDIVYFATAVPDGE